MRVLLITDNYLPHRGGSRIYFHNLLLHLDNSESTVVTKAQEGDRDFDSAQPYDVVRCPLDEADWLRPARLQFLPIYWNLWRCARRAAKQAQPDVIIAGELVPTGPIAARLGSKLGCPFVVCTHAECPSTLSRTRFQSRLASWVCRGAATVIAGSNNTRDALVDLLGVEDKGISIVPPAVGDEHFDPRYEASPCAEGTGTRRLLSVGRLVSRKGHLAVLEALPEILVHVPDLEYRIIGSGPMESQLRETIESMGLEKIVRLEGPLDDEATLRAYSRSDCFVLPNVDDPETGDTEGFVIVFGEASAHGLPVVGGRAGGTEHSIRHGKTGFRIDGNDRAAITSTVLEILTDPERAQTLGRTGRATAQREMRWSARAAAVRQILKEAISSKRNTL